MPANTQTGVQRRRRELEKVSKDYTRIDDVLSGERAVKAKTKEYLPVPDECTDGVYDDRYDAYITRALFYNATLPTRDALVGQLFLQPPIVDLPPGLEGLIENMDGRGLRLEELIRRAANYVLPFGRGGFLSDLPPTDGEILKSQIDSGEVAPNVRFFEPWAIRNWKVEKVGTKVKLTLLVLDEMVEKQADDDEFNIETKLQHRVYRLTDAGVDVRLFDEESTEVGKYTLKGQDGKPLKDIPFEFIGSENNDAEIDEPPFLNLANINLAHYRNSADYEESVFICGQPTLICAGISEDWMENYFPKGVKLGSRAIIPLNAEASAQLLQAEANGLAFEAMKHKENQMFSIGAKIIDKDQKVEKKEKEIEIDAASQKSVLTTIKENIEKALLKAVATAASFIGIAVDVKKHRITLNESFDLGSLDSEDLRMAFEMYNGSTLAFSEFREQLRRKGLATLSDDEAKTELKTDKSFKKSVAPDPEPVPGQPGGKPAGKPTDKPNPKKPPAKA